MRERLEDLDLDPGAEADRREHRAGAGEQTVEVGDEARHHDVVAERLGRGEQLRARRPAHDVHAGVRHLLQHARHAGGQEGQRGVMVVRQREQAQEHELRSPGVGALHRGLGDHRPQLADSLDACAGAQGRCLRRVHQQAQLVAARDLDLAPGHQPTLHVEQESLHPALCDQPADGGGDVRAELPERVDLDLGVVRHHLEHPGVAHREQVVEVDHPLHPGPRRDVLGVLLGAHGVEDLHVGADAREQVPQLVARPPGVQQRLLQGVPAGGQRPPGDARQLLTQSRLLQTVHGVRRRRQLGVRMAEEDVVHVRRPDPVAPVVEQAAEDDLLARVADAGHDRTDQRHRARFEELAQYPVPLTTAAIVRSRTLMSSHSDQFSM